MTFIVAIDGPSASGKGTIAQMTAKKLKFDYLNTGLLYRAVAYISLKNKIPLSDVSAILKMIVSINFSQLDGVDLMSSIISESASVIAAIPEVRIALIDVQRNFAVGKVGVIVEGRDIGTVIFPKADLKIYITATPEERAARRFKQLQNSGEDIIYEDVLKDLLLRDSRDSNRQCAPLTMCDNYILLDTTAINIDQSVLTILGFINQKL